MNRDRFELHDLVRKFFDRLVAEGIIEGLIGDDRFSVDGSLIRSMAGRKSVKHLKQGENDDDDLNSWGQSKGTKRSNATHRSVVDPEARLMSKGGEAHLRHSMHLLTDAHSGLCVMLRVDTADGRAERRNALLMLDHVRGRHGVIPKIVAADAGYGAGEFLCAIEGRGITPHAALAKGKIAGDSEPHRARKRMRRRNTTKQYKISQRLRRMIEPVIGWCKETGGLGRTRFVGHERIQNDGLLVASAWNLMRMVTLRGVT